MQQQHILGPRHLYLRLNCNLTQADQQCIALWQATCMRRLQGSVNIYAVGLSSESGGNLFHLSITAMASKA